MAHENVNMLWAEILVDELVRCGVRHAVLSPGSRSAPLALALNRNKGIKLHVIVDERSAAYFALGLCKAHEKACVVSTSGTAAANFLSAVVEADLSALGLVVLTADRPPALIDVGANQAIFQTRIFGDFVRWTTSLVPIASPNAVRHLRQSVCRACAQNGPSHLNVAFDEPLAPPRSQDGNVASPNFFEADALALTGRADGERWTRIPPHEDVPHPWILEAWDMMVRANPDGVIIYGPDSARSAPNGHEAGIMGMPLVADGLSRARTAFESHHLALANKRAARMLRPSWIIQCGASPTSRHVRQYLDEHRDVPRLVINSTGREWDESLSASALVKGHASRLLAGLARGEWADPLDFEDWVAESPIRIFERHGPPLAGIAGDSVWVARWKALEQEVQAVELRGSDWEGPIPRMLLDALEPEDLLWVGSSLPVRDIDQFATKTSGRILANRGASGIDGVLSSAAGAASVTKGRCLAYVGDLTFLHDLNGLAAVKKYAPHLTIVVLNNGGGRIFEHLPIADSIPREEFEELFLTPQDVDIGKACAAFGLKHVRLEGTAKLAATLKGIEAGVVEVVVDGRVAAKRRKEHLAKVVAAVDKLVDQWEKEDKQAGNAKSADGPRSKPAQKRQEKPKVRK